MHIRHIRPRSVDWYDALTKDEEGGSAPLSPEQINRLRALLVIGPGEIKVPHPLLRGHPRSVRLSAA